ncbi:MAG: four helix bundle protein [Kiritimatiellae bacterium]|nr:four helix bundle protein [Kiritimatiellia bacterium]
MSQKSLENFGAYQISMELFDLVVEDMDTIVSDPRARRLISQQVASADSICANIEEGHGRGSTKEYIQYLIIARGSARETRGRYLRFKHWLARESIQDRVSRCDEIIRILTKTINTLRQRGARS